MQAVSAATTTIPIVGSGAYTELGQVPSLARPGGNITGITVDVGWQSGIDGKRLQILKEALPSVSKVGVLTMRTAWDDAGGERFREAGRQLAISVTGMLLEKSTPSEYRREFAENAQRRPDAIVIIGTGELFPLRQLIAELAENNRLPAIYPLRDYAEAGGLMSYGSDLVELWRRMANDLHEVLNGVKPGDIPIYQPTKFELVINLKAAKALNLTLPATLLGRADEVIE
jgi:putative ABC transport system substrate-binding protein